MDKDKLLFLELRDSEDKLVLEEGDISSLSSIFMLKERESFTEGKYRNVFRKQESGSVRIVFHSENELLQGSKSVQRACAIYLSLIPKLKQLKKSHQQSFDAIARRFAHNLSKFQSRFKDNFKQLIPDSFRGRPFEELRNEVKRKIELDVDGATYSVCQMSHRATDLDAQIEALRIISGFADRPSVFLDTNIKRALYRLTNPFSDELQKKNVKIVLNINESTASQNKIKIVHELFNAAIWQIFDNVCKYVLKDTDVTITATLESDIKCLIIEMVSLTIDEDEVEKVFRENYRGRNAKDDEGSGIGLYIAWKALKLMNALISIKNNGVVLFVGGVSYSRHTFTITFEN